jgi:uncharacterized protein (DUF2062 family)
MKRNEGQIVSVVFAVIWGTLGLGALTGAVVAGAWWQLYVAGVCAVAMTACVLEYRKERKGTFK